VLAILLLLLGREAMPWLFPLGIAALWVVLAIAIVSRSTTTAGSAISPTRGWPTTRPPAKGSVERNATQG